MWEGRQSQWLSSWPRQHNGLRPWTGWGCRSAQGMELRLWHPKALRSSLGVPQDQKDYGANTWKTGLSLLVLGDGLLVLDEDSASASVAAITKYHRRCLLKQEKVILWHFGGLKSKTKYLQDITYSSRGSQRDPVPFVFHLSVAVSIPVLWPHHACYASIFMWLPPLCVSSSASSKKLIIGFI